MINFILAHCRVGQKKVGVEKAPQIIYNRLLEYHNKFNKNKNLSNHEPISEYSFECELSKGYNMIYNKYNEFLNQNNKPIITIGGDHSVALGSCQAFIDKYKEDGHIIWIDAHTDINTHKSSSSNNLHGMCVANLMGIINLPIINKQYNLKPEQITYLGPRSIDTGELELINKHNIKLFSSEDIRKELLETIDKVQNIIKDKIIHISFDIDVIDPILVVSTGTPVEKGLNMHDIYHILDSLTKNNLIASCDFVEYNPKIGNIKEKEKSLYFMEHSINTVIRNI